MKTNNDQFKIEIVKHKQSARSTRVLSTDIKEKDRVLKRLKEPNFTPPVSTERYKNSRPYQPQGRNNGCFNTIFHKKQHDQFTEKCINFLSRKKLGANQDAESKKSNFCTMLQNIKKAIKQGDKKDKESKQFSPIELNNNLMCVRTQIHQIYNNSEQKMQLYKLIKSNQFQNLKTPSKDKYSNDSPNPHNSAKYILNPFTQNKTIVCFTMALNQPQIIKKPLLQVPPARSISTSVGKRVVQIAKPSAPRGMCFQLSGDGDSQYMKKLKNFLDFLFKVNFSNNIYIPLDIGKTQQIGVSKYKVFIGKGNNSLLVKSLIKRRFWWEIIQTPQLGEINFYWSQNIVDRVHDSQKNSELTFPNGEKNLQKRTIDDMFNMNRKILSAQKCQNVERYITKEGFIIPYDEKFSPDLISNHLPRNYCIGSKKNLFKSLFHYFTNIKKKNPFDFIPKTYHIRSTEDQQYKMFLKQNQHQPEKVWIIKPGQNTNRGNGINLSTFANLQSKLKKGKHENGQPLTYIVQSYINKPFLYNNRKFDIRHYLLITSVNGLLKAYWYKDGYIRTSSQYFDLEDLDNPFIHLTNDAIQRHSEDYQKFQPANKLSYSEFQRYLDYTFPAKNYNFQKDIIVKMKQIATYIVNANYSTIDHKRNQNNFQIFGLDFMIDKNFKPWLIQVNYNPCLQVNCPVLQRIIPAMVENSFRIGLDPIFPPPTHFPHSKRFYLSDHYLKNLRYELIFDEQTLKKIGDNSYEFVDEKQEEEQYQDQGKQVEQLFT